MHRNAAIGVALTVGLTGCASTGAQTPRDQFVGGAAGDLRVLMDDKCPQAYPVAAMPDRGSPESGDTPYSGFAGLGLDMLANIGGIAFQSFGTYLKQAGEASVTRSVGANGGLFYTRPEGNTAVTFNPDMRCLYLVRNGFAPQAPSFGGNAADDLKQTWARLGLTQAPDLFAQLFLESSGDIGGGAMLEMEGDGEAGTDMPAFWNPAVSPPYFRLKLDRLYVGNFQAAAATPTRDLALIFNYGSAAARTVVVADGANAGAPELSTKFAVGGIRLAGARAGDYKGASLTALQSAWMPVPGVKSYDPRATFDLAAYVVEFAPGNPMLEDIGEYLAGADVRQRVESSISQATGGRDGT